MCCRRVIWLFILLGSFVSSCNKLSGTPSQEYTLLPGECLTSPALSFSTDHFRIVDNSTTLEHTGRFDYCLVFDFDMRSVLHKVPERSDRDGRYCPAENVFDEFGENSLAVKNAYETYWRDVASSTNWETFYVSTIFYDCGASLVADKDFARFKAGENILNDALSYDEWLAAEDRDHKVFISPLWPPSSPDLHLDGFQYRYALGANAIAIVIPWRGGELLVVDEDVTFTFKMPVKVGLYLTWLSNRLTDPNAPFPYREETLTCTFTAHKGLHKK